MTVPFISTDDLSDFMAQDLSGSDVAVIAIDSACESVRTFTRRRWNYVEDDVITLNGSGTDTVLIPEWPVIGDVLLELDGTEVTDFVVQTSRLVRLAWTVWPLGIANLSLTYSHGYAVTEADVDPDGPERVPSDVREVALAVAANLMSVSETRFHTISPRDSVGGSTPVEGPGPVALTREQRSILAHHRMRLVG